MQLSEEEKSIEELKRELDFYKSQTRVLREKNRDLRNALLLAGAEEEKTKTEPQETAEKSLSDIRKVIESSKKQISSKLSELKESIEKPGEQKPISMDTPPQPPSSGTPPVAEPVPKVTEESPKKGELSPDSAKPSLQDSAEFDVLKRQVDYLQREIERLETFLDQSERVNNRLRELLSEHSIDVSEISRVIQEASKTATAKEAGTARVSASPSSSTSPEVTTTSQGQLEKAPIQSPGSQDTSSSMISEERKRELDPTIAKVFEDFEEKINRENTTKDEITLEILDLREQLMELIPHSRVFYEMQMEYRRWKRGTSSKERLQEAIKSWKKTIASTSE
ncbi:MAG: hypothetical protein GF308_15115 [Candidatus Heimdallarchaeota archaeon]|nr:hypothetical protein [Candidatus Heimdallarchaeota archaeon]